MTNVHSIATLEEAVRSRESLDHDDVRRLVASKSHRVLIATKDKQTRVLLGNAMRHEGHRVVVVENGFLLIRLLADEILFPERTPLPDLIIADWRMHGCTGQSLLAGIRDLHWDTPVFVLTEEKVPTDKLNAERLGATQVFVKPIDLAKFCDATRLFLPTAASASSGEIQSTSTVGSIAKDSFHQTRRRHHADPARQCVSCGSRRDLRMYGSREGVAFCRPCSTPISALGFPEYYCDLGGG